MSADCLLVRRHGVLPHVWRLLRHRRIEVDVVVSPPLAGSDCRELTDQTREAVAGRYVSLA